ncbi:MAG: hypothetical protein U5N10_06715 [Gemmobacter sp.]|nr:hypothetical protein [Gemmobacter sp.]
MHEYKTVEAWLADLTAGRRTAIIPATLAAEALGETANAFTKRLKSGDLPTIKIGERTYLSADYVADEIKKKLRQSADIREHVERVARRGGKIFYGELMDLVGMSWKSPPDRKRIGHLLGELSRDTFKQQRIFLSSIVHRKAAEPTGPGPGYFDLITGLADEHDDVDYIPGEDEQGMTERHMKAVWAFYKKN